MATFFSGTRVYTWSGSAVNGTLTGNVSRSGNTVTLSGMSLSLTAASSVWGSDTLTFTVNGTSTSFSATGSGTSLGTHSLNNTSFNVSGSQTSASVGWSSSDGFSGSFTVTFPSGAPAGLSLSSVVQTTNSVSATVSVTAWNGGSDSTRYRELSLCTAQNTTQRKYETATGSTMSSTILVDNDTTHTAGTAFTISPNTRYYLTMYAYGSSGIGNSSYTQVVMLAPAPTITFASSTNDSATFNYSVIADGGFYNKNIQYSTDNGSTWTTGKTITGGLAQTGTFTVTGLSTGSYTLKVRVSTTAGITPGTDVPFTVGSLSGVGSVAGTGTVLTSGLCSVGGVATKITGVLMSVGGIAKK